MASLNNNWRRDRKVKDWQKAEDDRVERLIAEARADRSKDRMLKQAEMELAEGVIVNIADLVIEPTKEWLEKGESRMFSASVPGQTTRTLKATRRVFTPPVVRLYIWRTD